jgi:hypothetical protein
MHGTAIESYRWLLSVYHLANPRSATEIVHLSVFLLIQIAVHHFSSISIAFLA